MSWKVAHACVRGSSHQRSGLPNQDAVQCAVTPGAKGTIAVAVVSDGHGSARHFRSQIGSSLAVSTVTDTLQRFLLDAAGSDGAISFGPSQIEGLQRKLVEGWAASVQLDLDHNPFTAAELDALENEDGIDSRRSVESLPQLAYGATLLAAGATERAMLYLQLGDGEILSVNKQGQTTRPLPPDDRLAGNQTTSLCQPEAWKDFRSAWVKDAAMPVLVLLSTDGYVNSFRSDDDFVKIGQDYLEIIREQGIASLAEELPQILSEATQQGSGDDITLAILQDEPGTSGNGPAPVKPVFSAASKSALIEQLKARHSSQQQKLEELSHRVEQTQKDNRRLRNLIGLLVLAAVAIPVAVFRDKLLPHHTENKPAASPGNTETKAVNPTAPPKVPAPPPDPYPVSPPVRKQWSLRVNDGKALSLRKGSVIPVRAIHPQGSGETYAEVAEQSGDLLLINDSADAWTVKTGEDAKQTEKITRGQSLVLGRQPVEILFAKGITGALTAAAPAARPAGNTP